MIIKYTNFSDGLHQFNLTAKAEKLGLEDLFIDEVIVECKMDKSPHQIVLNCSLFAKVKYECDRCSKETERAVSNQFMLSYLFSKEKQVSDDFNLKIITPDEDKIDLSGDVFEYAELALPMKKLCYDDCKGMCSKCGKNLNEVSCNCDLTIENDIWAPLKSLKDKFNN